MTACGESNVPAFMGAQPAKTTPYGRETRYGAEEMRCRLENMQTACLCKRCGR